MSNAIRDAGDWPAYRADPGTSVTPNDPMLLGGQGAGFYSSLLPYTLNQTLTDLGFGWSGYGRASRDLDNPVIDDIFSIGARMQLENDGQRITRSVVPPLVTVRRRLGQTDGSNAYVVQNRLLGTPVYDVPEYKGTRFATGDVKLVSRCAAGSMAYLNLPRVEGQARLAGGRWKGLSATRRPGINTNSAMVELGLVPSSGVVLVEVNFGEDPQGITPTGAIGCLDQQRLDRAVRQLRLSGATDVKVGGHSINATLRPGSKGYAVVAVPRLRGWQCSAGDGKAQTPRSYGGLIAVRLTGSEDRIACSYTPPGLLRGLAVAAVAAAITLGIVLIGRRRRLRS